MQGLPFPIITYQVITGNYSAIFFYERGVRIITYQVITGNYSPDQRGCHPGSIITYQVITGNYSANKMLLPTFVL